MRSAFWALVHLDSVARTPYTQTQQRFNCMQTYAHTLAASESNRERSVGDPNLG